MSASTQRDLIRVYAAFRHISVKDVIGVSGEEAQLADGRQYARAGFESAAGLPLAIQAGFQDAGGTGMFTRSVGGHWKMTGYGTIPISCTEGVPLSVRDVWHLTACQAAASSVSGRLPQSTGSGATLNQKIAALAADDVGITDQPAATECNPFTTLENVAASSSGCDTNTSFGVKDRSSPWCADFTKYIWTSEGVTIGTDVLDPVGNANSFAAWGHDEGETLTADGSNVKVGDAVVFWDASDYSLKDIYNETDSADHVGIVTGVSGSTITLANGDFGVGTSKIAVYKASTTDMKTWAQNEGWSGTTDWVYINPAG